MDAGSKIWPPQRYGIKYTFSLFNSTVIFIPGNYKLFFNFYHIFHPFSFYLCFGKRVEAFKYSFFYFRIILHSESLI